LSCDQHRAAHLRRRPDPAVSVAFIMAVKSARVTGWPAPAKNTALTRATTTLTSNARRSNWKDSTIGRSVGI
jgi:hypothetical protein